MFWGEFNTVHSLNLCQMYMCLKYVYCITFASPGCVFHTCLSLCVNSVPADRVANLCFIHEATLHLSVFILEA